MNDFMESIFVINWFEWWILYIHRLYIV